MIYILGRDEFHEYNTLDEVIIIASTKIGDILEYLYKNEKVNNLYEYMILVKSENDCEYGEIRPVTTAYENFINFTPTLFLKKENKAEYENVKHQLSAWCNMMRIKRESEEKERKRAFEEAKEREERMLYERLKVKYGN